MSKREGLEGKEEEEDGDGDGGGEGGREGEEDFLAAAETRTVADAECAWRRPLAGSINDDGGGGGEDSAELDEYVGKKKFDLVRGRRRRLVGRRSKWKLYIFGLPASQSLSVELINNKSR